MMEDFPVALRMEAISLDSLVRMQMHATRQGGDLAHCDDKRKDNTIWYGEFGSKDFAKSVKEEIAAMAESNLENALDAMLKQGRHKDRAKREAEGAKNPFKASAQGPMREIILTANARYFYADPDDNDPYLAHRTTKEGDRKVIRLSRKKIKAFEKRGIEFFRSFFPGQVRHLRLDMDEEAPHFHALIVVKKETTSKRLGTQANIVPSANPLIKSYELAQNVAGEFFADIGLCRGERRAAACREAKKLSLPMPEKAKHMKPVDFRAERAVKIRAREADLDRQEEAAHREAEKIKSGAEKEASSIREEAKKIKQRAVVEAKSKLEHLSDEFNKALDVGVTAIDDERIC